MMKKKRPSKEETMEKTRIKPPEVNLDCPRAPEEREIRYRGYTEIQRLREETCHPEI
jgi:hypothetical protein